MHDVSICKFFSHLDYFAHLLNYTLTFDIPTNLQHEITDDQGKRKRQKKSKIQAYRISIELRKKTLHLSGRLGKAIP